MKTITIKIYVDRSCDMAKVVDPLGNGMEGNFWDFHNGCHGMYDLGEFNSYHELANVLRRKYISEGYNIKTETHKYKYI